MFLSENVNLPKIKRKHLVQIINANRASVEIQIRDICLAWRAGAGDHFRCSCGYGSAVAALYLVAMTVGWPLLRCTGRIWQNKRVAACSSRTLTFSINTKWPQTTAEGGGWSDWGTRGWGGDNIQSVTCSSAVRRHRQRGGQLPATIAVVGFIFLINTGPVSSHEVEEEALNRRCQTREQRG